MTANTRIDSLDALRGVAVLGILVINIVGFGIGEAGFFNPLVVGGDGALNHGLWTAANVLVEGSMRGLFSALFGASVILLTAKPVSGGAIGVGDIYYRRTWWLIALGLIHSFLLLGPGDILMIYGMAGLFLFPFRVLKARQLFTIFLILLVAMVTLNLSEELDETALGETAIALESRQVAGESLTEDEQETVKAWQELLDGYSVSADELEEVRRQRTGDLATLYASNADWVAANSEFWGMVWWTFDALMTMFLGMALFKWRILTGDRSTRFYWLLVVACYGAGLAFRIWAMSGRWDSGFSPLLWAWGSFDQLARLALTVGHIGLFFILWRWFAQSIVMRALGATGRMALTNYLGQTVAANLVFSGLGLKLFGVTFAQVYAVMLAIWLFQLVLSYWWMQRFAYGPVEWLWRGLTYWRRPPMRRTETANKEL